MIHSNDTTRNSGTDNRPQHQAAETIGSPLQMIHHLLRGRYLWAFLLCLLLGGALGYGGFKLAKVTYNSRGEVRIQAVLPSVTTNGGDDKSILSFFDSYVQAQSQLMASERVRDLAMQDPDWDSLRRGNRHEPNGSK